MKDMRLKIIMTKLKRNIVKHWWSPRIFGKDFKGTGGSSKIK